MGRLLLNVGFACYVASIIMFDPLPFVVGVVAQAIAVVIAIFQQPTETRSCTGT